MLDGFSKMIHYRRYVQMIIDDVPRFIIITISVFTAPTKLDAVLSRKKQRWISNVNRSHKRLM